MKIFKVKEREVWHIADEKDEHFQSVCRLAQYRNWHFDRYEEKVIAGDFIKGNKVKYFEGEKLCSTCVSRAYANGIVEIQEAQIMDNSRLELFAIVYEDTGELAMSWGSSTKPASKVFDNVESAKRSLKASQPREKRKLNIERFVRRNDFE